MEVFLRDDIVAGWVFRTVLLALALAAGPAPRTFASQAKVELFTEQEAGELRVEENDWDPIPRARSASLGPIIAIRNPEVRRIDGADTIETSSPTSMKVVFEPNQAPVDMGSLDITAKKGLFSKSLTKRLMPFVDGTTLALENVDIPSGKFQIQIVVKDHEGRETAQTYHLVVKRLVEPGS